MVKRNIIRSKLAEKEISYSQCAKQLGISYDSFCNKVNSKTPFKVNEITQLANFLKLTIKETSNIFLS